ncbi:dihydrodipicolinate reductase [Phenylobacterium zucineum HLK1]|uniref:4-hydroxy-tetrahydrodipicolinate reductase n=2 Tax=Phenylobacterium zucineum TaxID=284016 RepID=B4RC37_PHEZH|nr:dihydrodipicolinate reductase [Phenylobacterium zucineum HLK1]
MGQVVQATLADDPGFRLVGGFDRPGAAGEGVVPADQAIAASDVVVDFTIAAASAELAPKVAAAGKALVIGSTGFDDAQLAVIREAAREIPIVRAGNFSLGLNMLMGLVARAARALPAEAWDIEVVEAHHRRKVDAPSGAALMLGAAAADGRGADLAKVGRRSRDGITGERPVGEIGFSAIRGGGVVGEHSVIFAAEDEILTLSHSARDRSLFARGALAAARWVAGRPPGEYDMQDVLGMKDG